MPQPYMHKSAFQSVTTHGKNCSPLLPANVPRLVCSTLHDLPCSISTPLPISPSRTYLWFFYFIHVPFQITSSFFLPSLKSLSANPRPSSPEPAAMLHPQTIVNTVTQSIQYMRPQNISDVTTSNYHWCRGPEFPFIPERIDAPECNG